MALLPTATYLTRIEVRRHRGALVVLAALTALVVAVVLAALAGAERTGSAFDRYLAEVRAPEAAAFGEPDAMARLAGLDAVADTIGFEMIAAFPRTDAEEFYPLVVAEDGAIPFERMRFPVVEGRRPQRDAAYEVALGERTAHRLGVGVGDRLPLDSFTPDGVVHGDLGEPDGPPVTLEVVGIVRDPGDLGGRASDVTLTFLTPAFRDEHPRAEIGAVADGTMIVLAPGYQLRDVSQALGSEVELDAGFSAEAFRTQLDPTLRALATALRVFAGVAALAGVVAITLAAARLQHTSAADEPSLGALGTSRAARLARLAGPTAAATASGAVAGAVVSVAASPLFPIGLARRADPERGFAYDGPITLGGAAIAVVILVAITLVTALHQRRQAATLLGSRQASPWGRAAASAGAPTPIVTGLTLAGGTARGSAGIAAGGTVLGVVGILAVVVFAASVERLHDDPALYGWAWDAVIEGADLSDLGGDPAIADRVVADERVSAAGRYYSQAAVTVGGAPDYASALQSAKGALADPVVVRGSAPAGANEMALGQATLDRIGAQIGDEVPLLMGTAEAQLLVTGVTALPVSDDGGSLASGLLLSSGAADRLNLAAACAVEETSCTRKIAVELAEGVDPGAFAADLEAEDPSISVVLPTPPADIDRLTAVDDLPAYLAGFLATLAATAIAFATTITVRQQRRDLAVLRVLGMTARHVRTVVAVLVLALTAAGSVLGVVLGVAVGRQVWRWVAGALAVPFAPEIPLLALVLVPLGSLVLAQLVATGGRRAAARIPAALVLRAE